MSICCGKAESSSTVKIEEAIVMHEGIQWLLWSPPGVCSIVVLGLFLIVFSFFLEQRLSEAVRLAVRLLGSSSLPSRPDLAHRHHHYHMAVLVPRMAFLMMVPNETSHLKRSTMKRPGERLEADVHFQNRGEPHPGTKCPIRGYITILDNQTTTFQPRMQPPRFSTSTPPRMAHRTRNLSSSRSRKKRTP
jgi:hypothetical protein